MSKKNHNMPDSRQQCVELLNSSLNKAKHSELTFHLPKPLAIRQLIPRGHFHSNPEFFFQISGKITFTFPESRLTLSEGEVLMIPSWLCHSEKSPCYKNTQTIVVALSMAELTWHIAQTIKPTEYKTFNHGYTTSSKLNLLIRMCEELTHLRHDSARYDRPVFNAMTVAILYQVAEIIKSAGRQDQGMNHKISSCRHLINSNLANPQLNVQYLAKRLGCNADYLSHLFLSKVGVPLTEFINTRRTQVAISLLNSENMNISEVAYACGYSDPGYFSRIFRRLTGKSPGEFRKQPADNVF